MVIFGIFAFWKTKNKIVNYVEMKSGQSEQIELKYTDSLTVKSDGVYITDVSEASIEGMGFAIPISDVEDLIKQLINGENDTGGLTLGIEGYMTNLNNFSGYGLPTGFYISKIEKGSNADKADLEIGNIITEIDGNKVTSVEVIKKVLNKKEKGDTVKITIRYASKNEYKEKSIKVTLN